jgi:hypothetical protein
MNKKNILMVTDHVENGPVFRDWLGKVDDFDLVVVDTEERAIESAQVRSFDFVVIDSKSANINVNKLKAVFPILNEDVEFIIYEGESFEIFADTIRAAFDRKKKLRIQQLVILDTEEIKDWNGMPFSVN